MSPYLIKNKLTKLPDKCKESNRALFFHNDYFRFSFESKTSKKKVWGSRSGGQSEGTPQGEDVDMVAGKIRCGASEEAKAPRRGRGRRISGAGGEAGELITWQIAERFQREQLVHGVTCCKQNLLPCFLGLLPQKRETKNALNIVKVS